MDAKAQQLKAWLDREFQSAGVEYEFKDGMHKFRINIGGSPYWLYISREFVADHDVGHVIHCANRARILDAFRVSTMPKWFFLGEREAREVDENFMKRN